LVVVVLVGGVPPGLPAASDGAQRGAFDAGWWQRGKFAPAVEEVLGGLHRGSSGGGGLDSELDQGGYAALLDEGEEWEPLVAFEGPADDDSCCGESVNEWARAVGDAVRVTLGGGPLLLAS
jgi:hypothetical protein